MGLRLAGGARCDAGLEWRCGADQTRFTRRPAGIVIGRRLGRVAMPPAGTPRRRARPRRSTASAGWGQAGSTRRSRERRMRRRRATPRGSLRAATVLEVTSTPVIREERDNGGAACHLARDGGRHRNRRRCVHELFQFEILREMSGRPVPEGVDDISLEAMPWSATRRRKLAGSRYAAWSRR